jgi:beta-carotene 15,15'-dioxygenase
LQAIIFKKLNFLAEKFFSEPRAFFYAAAALTSLLPAREAFGLVLLGLAVFGMAHGAVDQYWDPMARSEPRRFYFTYMAMIFLYLLVWREAPFLAFLFFIALSSYHFGECQWRELVGPRKMKRGDLFFILSWGFFAATFSPLFHWQESAPIVRSIAGFDTINEHEALVLATVIGAIGIISSLRDRKFFLSTLLLLLSLVALPLITGFLCFFVFWHSWDSVRHQRQLAGWSFRKYLAKTIPFSGAAWVGTFAAAGIAVRFGYADRLSLALFLVLASLTLPHAIVMRNFYTGQRSMDQLTF